MIGSATAEQPHKPNSEIGLPHLFITSDCLFTQIIQTVEQKQELVQACAQTDLKHEDVLLEAACVCVYRCRSVISALAYFFVIMILIICMLDCLL